MTKISPKSTAEVRTMNRNRVYRYLYSAEEPLTKQDLAYGLSMSLPTLTQNLSELIDRGLIENSGTAKSAYGRKPHVISIVPAARFAVGVEISLGHIRMVAVDLQVNELATKTVTKNFSSNEAYAEKLGELIVAFIKENKLDTNRLLGVGIAVPGTVDAKNSVISNAPTLGVAGLKTKELTAHIPYETTVMNDANAGGFAEWWDRTSIENMAYLSLGRGVGGAILIGGEPYIGVNCRSGEFGHMCIHPGGLKCSCGRQGCLEAYCSTAVVSDDLGIAPDEFFNELEKGRKKYIKIWDAYLDDLVIGIRNINAMLDCRVVIGGKLSMFLAKYMSDIKQRLEKADPNYSGEPYLSICRYSTHASGIGAALFYIDSFIAGI